MEETNVYICKLPTECLNCRFAYDGKCQAKENRDSYCVENCRRNDCPLIDIKEHDRELVKEVFKQINVRLGSIEDMLINLGNGKEDALNYFVYILNEIQKEYEK